MELTVVAVDTICDDLLISLGHQTDRGILPNIVVMLVPSYPSIDTSSDSHNHGL